MKLEILGTGCAKCKTLEAVAKEAVAKVGGFHEIVKVDDIMEIIPELHSDRSEEKPPRGSNKNQ